MARGRSGKGVTIVVRREEVVAGGHHGGAWKVAYADFVTAMMAFFLLMWLLNATTEQQRKGIADYFTPNNVMSRGSSGSGLPFDGTTPFADGSMVSDRGAIAIAAGEQRQLPNANPDDTSTIMPQPDKTDDGGSGVQEGTGAADTLVQGVAAQGVGAAAANRASPAALAAATSLADSARDEKAAFARAAAALRTAVAADPALGDLAKQLVIDETPQGLRIQLVDRDKQPMFAFGSADLDDRARRLLLKVAPVLNRLPEKIAITGHTDGAPYVGGDTTNWELSAGRANATRRLLVGAGLAEARLQSVTGVADRDPLVPANPMDATNRRIAIVVLRTVQP